MPSDAERMQSDWDERADEDAFHFIGTSYDTSDIDYFFKMGEDHAKKSIDPILEDWDDYPLEGGTALDIGCGAGRMTRALADRFGHVVGIDVSEKMIERAKSLNENYSNIEFYSNDGEQYTAIDDTSIDFVFSYVVFQHFPNKSVIKSNVNEISRVLKTGGRTNIHFKPSVHRGERYINLFGYVPFPTKFVQYVPDRAKRLYSHLNNNDIEYEDLKSSDTWTGTSITPSEFWSYHHDVDLEVLQFIPDNTHSIGARFFCVANKKY